MIQKILDKIKSSLSAPTLELELESYVQSRNPKTLSDIEHLTKEFERRRFLQGDAKL